MLTARIEKIRQNYVNAKPQISCERAALWTESYKRSAGKPVCIRSADKKAQLSGWEQLATQEYGIKVTSYK